MDKLKGWIISNGGLKTAKYMEIMDIYIKTAAQLNIYLELIFNNELIMGIADNTYSIKGIKTGVKPDFVVFLDKDIRLAWQLEQMGLRLFNKSEVIATCDDKSRTFQALANKGIRMPKTIIAPLIFRGCEEDSETYRRHLEKELSYPMIIKESYGSFGEQVFLVQDQEELRSRQKELLYRPHIYQEFIASSKGRDVRLNVVGNTVVAGMLRTSHKDFRANVTCGGQMEAYKPSKDFEEMAVDVCEMIGADFAGVDLLFGEDGKPILCEINSNAHIKNIQTCTGVNIAQHILKYILKELMG